jgi:hypothetical protein
MNPTRHSTARSAFGAAWSPVFGGVAGKRFAATGPAPI